MKTHLIIPDTQVKAGVPLEHLHWLGCYIRDLKPDVIVHLGDHWDFPSLSSYDKGTAVVEGRRVVEDISVGIDGMAMIDGPLLGLQKEQKKARKASYSPRKVFLLGNHEERLKRYMNHNPELVGMLGYDNLKLKEMGWEMHDFLEVVNIDDILYSHYFSSPLSGRPIGGKAANLLTKIGKSFVQGHRQELDFTARQLCDGTRQIGIIAGAFYQHNEEYKGLQGNHHWRGVVTLREVEEGWGDPQFISLGYLQRKYS